MDKYLNNQQEIQQKYPKSVLIMATCENDFATELQSMLESRQLRGNILIYNVSKPDYARHRVWNISSGREAIRKYFLKHFEAKYLLCLDADMTFNPSIITIMLGEIQDHDVVFSGSPARCGGVAITGEGCMMLTREILQKIKFKCLEFRTGAAFSSDNMLEIDLFTLHSRIKKGYFVTLSHYFSQDNFRNIYPGTMSILRRLINNNLIRYFLLNLSVIIQYNIPLNLKRFVNRFITV